MEKQRPQIGISWKLSAYEELDRLGFDFMDVFGTDMMAMSPEEFEHHAGQVDRGRMPCRSLCLYCSAGLQLLGEGYDPGAVADYAARTSARCARLGITAIGIGSGGSRTIPEGYPVEKAEEQLLQAVRITAREAAKYGIAILMEPLNRFLCNHMLSTRSAVEFVRRVDMDNVAIVYDLHHSVLMGERPEDMGPFVPCMRSVQFNEIDFVTGDKLFPVEKHLGLYAHWLRTMMELGYRGPFSIEALTTADFSADAKRTRDIVRKLTDLLS